MTGGGEARLVRGWRRLRGWLWARRSAETLVFGLALALLATAYFTNSDMDGHPEAVRGDGTYHPVMARGDGHMMFLMTRSLVMDGDLNFDNDLRRFGDPWHQPTTVTGYRDINMPIGPSLVWAPFLAMAHGLSKVANLFGADIPSHGYTLWHQRLLYTTSLLFALGACLLGWLVARRLFGGRWAPLVAAMAVLFGTSLTYYAAIMPSYAHAMDGFMVAAFLAMWAVGLGGVGQVRWRRTLALGVLLGLAALVRVQEYPFGIVFAIELAWLVRRPPEGTGRWRWAGTLLLHGAVALAVALVMFVPQLVTWKIIYGEFFHYQNGPHYVRFDHPQVLFLLFSSRNGWLSTTPIAYAGVVGLVCGFWMAPRRLRPVMVGLVAALMVQVYLNSCIYNWWCDASFGNRRLCSVTLIVVVGLAALLRAGARVAARVKLPRWGRFAVAGCVLGWFVVWNCSQALALRHGRAAGHYLGQVLWPGVSPLQRAVAEPVERVMGNPFALPASAWFAERYGVPLERWDELAGFYWYEPGLDLIDGGYRKHRGRFPISGRDVAAGLGPRRKIGGRKARVMTGERARVLVPLIQADRYRISVPVARVAGAGPAARVAGAVPAVRVAGVGPAVTVSARWNGERVAGAVRGPGWGRLTFVVHGRVGINLLEIEAPANAVAVGDPDLSFPQ